MVQTVARKWAVKNIQRIKNGLRVTDVSIGYKLPRPILLSCVRTCEIF